MVIRRPRVLAQNSRVHAFSAGHLSTERGAMQVLQAVLCTLLLALCASLAVGLQAGTHSAPSKVVVLTDEDFDERTSSSGDWLINIYAPW